ncbi:MAG TPA: Uma2 family endonuclease [Allosphingosinicella sp.]|nr:Uma2 family endonuclease [Allosphingosinicella sp.]
MTAHDLLKPPGRYRLKVADYLTLDRSGAFEGMRTELIDGEVIVMNPQTRRHLFVKSELAYRLRRALEAIGSSLFVAVDGTVELTGNSHSLPEPDIFLTSAPHGEGFVPVESVALAVEVAATSLELDLERKAPLYARHGITEYWVVDVNRGLIHQMWAPEGEAYRRRQEVAFGQRIDAATIEKLAVETMGLSNN